MFEQDVTHTHMCDLESNSLSISPRMDAFGDNFVNNELEEDPAAEFLAREQDQLAGLEDDITPMAVTLAAAATADSTDGTFDIIKEF